MLVIAAVAVSSMKKVIILSFLFILLVILINFCPVVSQWDKSFIMVIQKKLAFLPLWLPMLPDCILYTAMIVIPLFGFSVFFIKKRLYWNLLLIYSVPLVTFLINCIIKPIIKRPRPSLELQITTIHPDSFSFVSSHSLVTICLWSMVIFYLYKYCENKIFRNIGIIISIIWILFVGLSRIWIGVHNPTDVLGAYILGLLLIYLYIKIGNEINKISN